MCIFPDEMSTCIFCSLSHWNACFYHVECWDLVLDLGTKPWLTFDLLIFFFPICLLKLSAEYFTTNVFTFIEAEIINLTFPCYAFSVKYRNSQLTQDFLFLWFQISFLKIFFIHICIQCLGHFSPLPSTPSLTPLLPLSPPTPPRYQAETILPLSPILLKRQYKQ
jgi:hypothetical protein